MKKIISWLRSVHAAMQMHAAATKYLSLQGARAFKALQARNADDTAALPRQVDPAVIAFIEAQLGSEPRRVATMIQSSPELQQRVQRTFQPSWYSRAWWWVRSSITRRIR